MADQEDNESMKVKQVRNFVVYDIKYYVISHLQMCYLIVLYLKAQHDMI